MPAYKTNKSGKSGWYTEFYYTDWTGIRKKKFKRGFLTKREADAWEREFLERQANGTEGMTFAALVDIYLEDCRLRLKPTTFSQKEFAVRLKLLPYFKDCLVSEITPAQVRKWQNHLLAAEYKPGHSEKDMDTKPRKYAPTYLKTLNAQLWPFSILPSAITVCRRIRCVLPEASESRMRIGSIFGRRKSLKSLSLPFRISHFLMRPSMSCFGPDAEAERCWP